MKTKINYYIGQKVILCSPEGFLTIQDRNKIGIITAIYDDTFLYKYAILMSYSISPTKIDSNKNRFTYFVNDKNIKPLQDRQLLFDFMY